MSVELNTKPPLITQEGSTPEKGTFHSLPDELKQKILSFLDLQSLTRAEQVCHEWTQLASDDFMWKPVFLRDFPLEVGPKEGQNWKTCYRNQFFIDSNIRSGKVKCEDIRITADHSLSGYFDPHHHRLYLGSDDKFLVYSIEDQVEYLGEFQGHATNLCCSTNTQFFYATRNSILIWDVKNADFKSTLPRLINKSNSNHTWITSLCTDGKELFTTGTEGKFCIWDLKGNHVLTLPLESAADTMCYSEGKLFLGLEDTIQVWDTQEKKWLDPFNVPLEEINSLHAEKGKLFSGSTDSLHMWDIETGKGQELQKSNKTSFSVNSLCMMGSKLIVNDSHFELNIVDIHTNNQFPQKLDENLNTAIYAVIGAQNGKVITKLAPMEQAEHLVVDIRIWDFNEPKSDSKNQKEEVQI